MITKLVHGRKYKCIGNSAGNGGNPIGKILECVLSGGRQSYPDGWYPGASAFTLWDGPGQSGAAYSMYARDVSEAWETRKEHADFEEIELKELEKKAAEKRHLIKRLREFDSDEMEIAAMMIRAVKDSTDLSEQEAIKNLAKTLKGRLRTDLL